MTTNVRRLSRALADMERRRERGELLSTDDFCALAEVQRMCDDVERLVATVRTRVTDVVCPPEVDPVIGRVLEAA